MFVYMERGRSWWVQIVFFLFDCFEEFRDWLEVRGRVTRYICSVCWSFGIGGIWPMVDVCFLSGFQCGFLFRGFRPMLLVVDWKSLMV